MTRTEEMREIRESWGKLLPANTVPDERQWCFWYLIHEPDVIRQGIATLVLKYEKLRGQMTPLYMVKFASTVMNRLSNERIAARVAARQEVNHSNKEAVTA